MKEVLDAETYLSRMKNQKINYDKVLRKILLKFEYSSEKWIVQLR